MLKTMNRNQKIVLLSAGILILLSLIVWWSYGGEFWTKTEVLVEIKDELFDSSYKEWQDKFVLGFDYTLLFDIIVVSFAFIGYFAAKKRD